MSTRIAMPRRRPRCRRDEARSARTTFALASRTSRADLGRELARDQNRRDDGSADLVRVLAVRGGDGLPRHYRRAARRTDVAVATRLDADRRLRRPADGHVLGAYRTGIDTPSARAFVGTGLLDAPVGRAAIEVVASRAGARVRT